MKNIFSPVKIGFIAVLMIILTACSVNVEDIDSRTAVSSFIRETQDIFAFGSADLDEILIKAKYEKVPKFGMMLEGELKQFKEVLDMDVPVYYAVQGPMNNNDMPEATYAFLSVKNTDLFVEDLVKRGFDIDEKAEIKTGQDEGFAIGIRGKLAIVIVKDGDFDGEKMLKEAFAKTEGDPAEDRVNQILDSKGDLVFGVNMASLYNTSNTDLSKLSKDKQKEIEEMVNDSYIETVVRFEDGAAVIETKNYFSQKLKDRMFLKSDPKAPLLAKLGKGAPRMGVAINIDMDKMQQFMDEFSPDAADELARAMGGPGQIALMAGGKDGLAGLFDGRFGFVLYSDGQNEPDFNFFIGLRKNGVGLAEMGKGFIEESDGKFEVTANSAALYSNPSYAPPGKLQLPQGCEKFGKSAVSGFISFEGLNFDEMDLEGEENLIRSIRYITIDYNNDGGTIYLKAKDGKENVLEQFVQQMVTSMTEEINHMPI